MPKSLQIFSMYIIKKGKNLILKIEVKCNFVILYIVSFCLYIKQKKIKKWWSIKIEGNEVVTYLAGSVRALCNSTQKSE